MLLQDSRDGKPRNGSIIKTQIFLYCLSSSSPCSPICTHSTPLGSSHSSLGSRYCIWLASPAAGSCFSTLDPIIMSSIICDWRANERGRQASAWTPAGCSCQRTLLVPRAKQETMDSMALCCCFWEEERLEWRSESSTASERWGRHNLHLHLDWKD